MVSEVRGALAASGHYPARYAQHGFRIGTATAAASRRLEDWTIQTLRRWHSDAYKRYEKLDKRLGLAFRTWVRVRVSVRVRVRAMVRIRVRVN